MNSDLSCHVQTSQSSVKVAVLLFHLLISVFIHTNLPFLMHLPNYSLADGNILPGIHSLTNRKNLLSDICTLFPTMATVIIFHSNLLKSHDSTQIFSQLKITNQKATLSFLSQPPAPSVGFFSMKILASQIVSAEMHGKAKIFSEDFKNLSHLRR